MYNIVYFKIILSDLRGLFTVLEERFVEHNHVYPSTFLTTAYLSIIRFRDNNSCFDFKSKGITTHLRYSRDNIHTKPTSVQRSHIT